MSAVASMSADLNDAQKRAQANRQTHAEKWAAAVKIAETRLSKIDADQTVPYGDFVRGLAGAAHIDIPMAKRVFDLLQSRGDASYKFGEGVRKLSKSA